MRILLLFLFMINCLAPAGQLYIGPGAQLTLDGNAVFTVRDMTMVNYGAFSSGASTFYLAGTANSNIGGTEPWPFYNVEINKAAGRSLVLQLPISVSGELRFTGGFVNLNGYDLDLGNTGRLMNESETACVIGATGGEVLITADLDAPVNANPGNLGALISSSQNLGSTVIKRGHQAQNIPGGAIHRYYDISSTHTTSLNATLRIHYLDIELNGLMEAGLAAWRSDDGSNWAQQGYTTRDASQNYVELTGIDAFSLWTLSPETATLPVTFTGFYLQCAANNVILQWKTAQEFNSSHFVMEKNTGTGWVPVGRIPAAGNSNVEKSYEFIDQDYVERAYYRIAQYDIDGQMKYTNILIADCNAKESLQAWPNPFRDVFTIRVQSERSGPASMRVTDSKGAFIVNRPLRLQRGINQFPVDIQQAASGIYLLTVEWADGRQLKTIRLIKQ